MTELLIGERVKPQCWTIHNTTWLFTLFVRINDDLMRAAKWVDQKLGTMYSKGTLRARSFLPADDADCAIVFCEVPGGGTAAHEAVHCACHVLTQRGMGPMCQENDEAYAYLVDWIVREIGKRVWE